MISQSVCHFQTMGFHSCLLSVGSSNPCHKCMTITKMFKRDKHMSLFYYRIESVTLLNLFELLYHKISQSVCHQQRNVKSLLSVVSSTIILTNIRQGQKCVIVTDKLAASGDDDHIRIKIACVNVPLVFRKKKFYQICFWAQKFA